MKDQTERLWIELRQTHSSMNSGWGNEMEPSLLISNSINKMYFFRNHFPLSYSNFWHLLSTGNVFYLFYCRPRAFAFPVSFIFHFFLLHKQMSGKKLVLLVNVSAALTSSLGAEADLLLHCWHSLHEFEWIIQHNKLNQQCLINRPIIRFINQPKSFYLKSARLIANVSVSASIYVSTIKTCLDLDLCP